MDVRELLIELYGRITSHVHQAVTGLDAEQLVTAPEPGANPIGWLVWHLTRVQDHHLSELRELLGLPDPDQVWVTGDWAERFGLAADPQDHGYGHTPAQVAAVRPYGPDALIGYYEAVADRTRELLASLTPADLDRIVDKRWNPPVTLGVRLVSVADDDIQHAGQANYLRGLLDRRTPMTHHCDMSGLRPPGQLAVGGRATGSAAVGTLGRTGRPAGLQPGHRHPKR